MHLLTDSAGTVTDQYEYEAFGSLLWQTGGTANPYRFTGERYDADLDLYYLRTRWYNQATGRFLTRDTYPLNAQNPIEWNRYLYTANNPANWVDPSGLSMGYIIQSNRSISVVLPSLPKVTALIFVTTAVVAFVLFSKNKAERKDINRAVRNYNRNNNCNIDPNHFREWMHRYYKDDARPRGFDLTPEEILDALEEYADLFCGR